MLTHSSPTQTLDKGQVRKMQQKEMINFPLTFVWGKSEVEWDVDEVLGEHRQDSFQTIARQSVLLAHELWNPDKKIFQEIIHKQKYVSHFSCKFRRKISFKDDTVIDIRKVNAHIKSPVDKHLAAKTHTSSFRATKMALKLSACAKYSSKPLFFSIDWNTDCLTITSASTTAAIRSFSTICRNVKTSRKYKWNAKKKCFAPKSECSRPRISNESKTNIQNY